MLHMGWRCFYKGPNVYMSSGAYSRSKGCKVPNYSTVLPSFYIIAHLDAITTIR